VTAIPEAPLAQQLAETLAEPLAHTLARETQNDPDLARVAEAWPNLPEVIRRAVLALVSSQAGEDGR
jgi:hypothetical protein